MATIMDDLENQSIVLFLHGYPDMDYLNISGFEEDNLRGEWYNKEQVQQLISELQEMEADMVYTNKATR